MKYLLGSKKDFKKFLEGIGKEDKIAILSHNDLDGISSAIFLEEILRSKGLKVDYLDFLSLSRGMFNKPIKDMKKLGITKVFVTDLNADSSDFGFEKVMEKFDYFLIDHHPFGKDIKKIKNVIKSESADCAGLVLYDLGKDYFEVEKLDWLVCSTMVSEFSFNKKENLAFLRKKYSGFNLENIDDSKPKEIEKIIGNALNYYNPDFKKVYYLVKEKNFKELKKTYEVVEKELAKAIKKYKKEAKFYPDKNLFFGEVNPKFYLTSIIATILSRKEPEKTFILVGKSSAPGMLRASMRNQGGTQNVNLLARRALKGLKDSTGGGHACAASALFRKEDLNKFKENILK